MHQAEPELRTADALALAKLDAKLWENMVGRGQFSEAPPTTTTHPRMFDTDDVITLHAIRHHLDRGTGPAMAGRVGAVVRRELRKAGPEVEYFWIVWASATPGTPSQPCRMLTTPPPDSVISERFPLAQMRRLIREAVRAKLAEPGK